MKNWFNNPTTLEDLKKQYKKLAIENHPDRGGRTEDMQAINAEYDRSWIWITGNTFTHKEELKKLHFKYSKNKNAWYYHEPGYRKSSKKSFTLEDIRNMFGSETVNGSQNDKLEAAYA